jgi:hypothetical protein
MSELLEPHRLILQLCMEEQVGLWFVIPHIDDFYRGDDRASIKSRTSMVLEALMKDGLIRAGAPTKDGRGFVPWELSTDGAITRIEKEWSALGREPSIGDIVWFAATPAGERLIDRLIPRKKN